MPRVPTTKDVLPGALVNVVLKADQPTGRTVSGTVGTLLTRGNHPRGIKVRLTDGRVGRVQSMGGRTENGESSPMSAGPATAASRVALSTPELPSQHIGLDAYITKPRQNRKGGNDRGSRGSQGGVGMHESEEAAEVLDAVACPVCGDFKGDEAAVAHHVSSHFVD
ncbi:hypothetical protein BJX76DRAFT_21377 [Aspergillus varians]